MRSAARVLTAAAAPGSLLADSDKALIVAAILCALICAVATALVARCAWLRYRSSAPPPSLNKGLKKSALNSLPKLLYTKSSALKAADCAICLAEFVEGEEVRVLQQCGHGFHLTCVDTWLAKHSSCPYCRAVLFMAAPPQCRRCSAASANDQAADDRILP